MRRSRLLQDLKPFFLRWLTQGAEAGLTVQEGPGIDVVGGYQVGIGGDMVLVYHADRSPVSEYTSIGLACAAAVAGDVVQPQAGTYAESFTIPANVEVVGRGRENTVISGVVTGGVEAVLRDLSVVIDGDDAGILYAVKGSSGEGTLRLYNCNVLVDNATGNAAALYSDGDGEIEAYGCRLRGVSAAADGWAAYCALGGAAGLLAHCEYEVTTDVVYEE